MQGLSRGISVIITLTSYTFTSLYSYPLALKQANKPKKKRIVGPLLVVTTDVAFTWSLFPNITYYFFRIPGTGILVPENQTCANKNLHVFNAWLAELPGVAQAFFREYKL
jgi:hypothetical protein